LLTSQFNEYVAASSKMTDKATDLTNVKDALSKKMEYLNGLITPLKETEKTSLLAAVNPAPAGGAAAAATPAPAPPAAFKREKSEVRDAEIADLVERIRQIRESDGN
jgi:hypothetical protein